MTIRRLVAVAICTVSAACLLGCQKKPAIDSRALDGLVATVPFERFDSATFSGKIGPCATDEQTATSYFGLMKRAMQHTEIRLLAYAFRPVRLKDGAGKLGALRLSISYPIASDPERTTSTYTEYFLISAQCRAMFLTKSVE